MNTSHEPLKLTKRGRIAAGVLAGVLTAGGAIAYANHESQENDKKITTERVEALKNAHSVLNNVIMLKNGTRLRTTPETLNGTPDNGEPNNVEHIIPDGKVMVVRMAEMDEENHPGWIAFAEPEADVASFTSLEQRASHTLWANYTELVSQNMVTETGYQSVSGQAIIDFHANPLGKTPNDTGFATSMEVDEQTGHVAKFIVTGERQ
jgi:hypothetical protein